MTEARAVRCSSRIGEGASAFPVDTSSESMETGDVVASDTVASPAET